MARTRVTVSNRPASRQTTLTGNAAPSPPDSLPPSDPSTAPVSTAATPAVPVATPLGAAPTTIRPPPLEAASVTPAPARTPFSPGGHIAPTSSLRHAGIRQKPISHDLLPTIPPKKISIRPRLSQISIGSTSISTGDLKNAVDDPDDSDDEPARATLTLLKSGRSSFLAPMVRSSIVKRGLIKQRRHLYGNARISMDHTRGNPARSLTSWYRRTVSSRCSLPVTPTLPASAWENTSAVLYYTPCSSNPPGGVRIKGYLRLLRCPVDYAPPGKIPAIYGVNHPEPMLCRHDMWSHDTAWARGPCTRLRFSLGGTITPATDGAWDRLVLADVPQDAALRQACSSSLHSPPSSHPSFDTEAYGKGIFEFDRLKQAHKVNPTASPGPLHRGDHSPLTGCMQALLPRIFPLGKGGDVPADLVLTVYDAPAAWNIQRWRRENVEADQLSISVEELVQSSWFELWTSAILQDDHFFTVEAKDFIPAESAVYADAYGSALVTRNMGLDTLYYCCGKGATMMEEVLRKNPGCNPVGNKDIGCLSFIGVWCAPNIAHYGKTPPMRFSFPGLSLPAATLQTPPETFDLSSPTPPHASPARASAASSPSQALFPVAAPVQNTNVAPVTASVSASGSASSSTPVQTTNVAPVAASASASGSAPSRGPLKRAHVDGQSNPDPSRPSPHAPHFAPVQVPRATLSVFRFVDAVGLHHTVTTYGPSIPGDPYEIDDVTDAVQPVPITTQRRPPSPAQYPATSPSLPRVARPSEWDQFLDPAPAAPAASHPVAPIRPAPEKTDAWGHQQPHVPDASLRPPPDAAWRQEPQPDPWAAAPPATAASPGRSPYTAPAYNNAATPPRDRGYDQASAYPTTQWPSTPPAMDSPQPTPWGLTTASSPSLLTGAAYFGSAPAAAPAAHHYGGHQYSQPHVYHHQAPAPFHPAHTPHHPLKRLGFLGACPWGGRRGHLVEPHATFQQFDVAHEFRIRNPDPSAADPFTPAPPTVVVMADLRPEVIRAFPVRQGHHNSSSAASAAANRFERVIRDQTLADLRVLASVTTDCGFFDGPVFDSISQGSIWVSPGIPSAARLSSSFSVFTFLRMQPGHDNIASLPQGGWLALDQAHHFIASIQWFIVDNFGPAVGPGSFMYRGLAFIRNRLDNQHLIRAWDTIAKRSFSIVIINLIHELWNVLYAWEEGAVKVPIYYLAHNSRVEVSGAAPFSDLARTESIDVSLSSWIERVNRRFPVDHLEQANAFSERIPSEWNHIFATGGRRDPSPPGNNPDHIPTGGAEGDPNNPRSRSFAGNLLEKVPGHRDSVRTRNSHCVSAIRPFPTFQPTPRGESLEICFGASCKGLRCLQQGNCNQYHLAARGPLRTASRESTAAIRHWLDKPAVRARIRLTAEAAALPCFRASRS